MPRIPLALGYMLLLTATASVSTQVPDNFRPTGQMSTVTSSLNQLMELNADFLIPKSFDDVKKNYAKYTRVLRDGKSSRDIEKAYLVFETAINFAREKLKRVNEVLMIPLAKRTEAQRVNSPTIVSDVYESAEKLLARAILKLEENRVSEAFVIGQEAAILYEEARTSVIKISLIGPSKIALSEAFRNNWDKLAPVSFERARRLLDEVTSAVDREEPISVELRQKANAVDYATRRAVELATQIDTLRLDLGNWEYLLLSREALVQQAADEAGLTANFLSAEPKPLLTESLRLIREEKDSLVTRIRRSELNQAALKSVVDSLNQAIDQQQIRLASMVENYQQDLQRRKEELEQERREVKNYLHEKIQLDAVTQAQTRFSESEAIVVREVNQLTLHLIGISFSAGKTVITKKAIKLLTKLGDFLSLYPKTRITVEGHTDSTGSETKNIVLSKDRADAIMRFLTEQSGIQEARITATGLGSSLPIASNKSRDGRDKNRRIDLIIYFSREP